MMDFVSLEVYTKLLRKSVIPEKESAGKRMTYPARVPITGRLKVHIREKEER